MYVELHRRMTNKGHMLPDEIKLVSQKRTDAVEERKTFEGANSIYTRSVMKMFTFII